MHFKGGGCLVSKLLSTCWVATPLLQEGMTGGRRLAYGQVELFRVNIMVLYDLLFYK